MIFFWFLLQWQSLLPILNFCDGVDLDILPSHSCELSHLNIDLGGVDAGDLLVKIRGTF